MEKSQPHLSLIVPFYDEEACVARVISDICSELDRNGIHFELVAVQNGSKDRTGEILRGLKSQWKNLRVVEVDENRGFGFGVLQGLSVASGNIAGYMVGDGQIDPEVVPRLLKQMELTNADIGKGRRAFRNDGWLRRAISVCYNLLVRILFSLETDDANSNPKLLTRHAYSAMGLRSHNFFIDLEVMLKAKKLGFRVCEVNLNSSKREMGRSKLRLAKTSFEFLRDMFRARFSKRDQWGLN